MNAANAILKLLDLLVVGTLSYERIQAARARVQAMVAEGRDPTVAEWESLFADIKRDSSRLDAADERLSG